jgi:uncharacterized flavoprotein (TIGR03862 family)
MNVVIVGAGPAGLMAAEVLSAKGCNVDVYDAMPSAGRKFLLAGKGGLNLTHSESFEPFVGRYGSRASHLQPLLSAFGANELRAWSTGLGVETFVGTSGRVFPREMKAAPLLRAWLQRLRAGGVRFHMRHRWTGWDADGQPRFMGAQGEVSPRCDALVLALGGASWPRLGSDGAWVPLLQARGVTVAPLRAANCGFDIQGGWSDYFSSRFAGQPFKSVAMEVDGHARKGEFVATASGIEGSLVYAFSAALRDQIEANGHAELRLDLLPSRSAEQVTAEVMHPRGSRSLASHLKSRLALDGIKLALLYECLPRAALADPVQFAAGIKAVPMRLSAPRPIAEAISTAGGVPFEALDERMMLRSVPGVYCAGEMLDWEAPTGGYLLTACFATGVAVAHGVLAQGT